MLHLHKLEQIETTFDFRTISVLQLPMCVSLFWFTGSQSNLNTHSQRQTLQRSPQSRKSHCFRCCSNTRKPVESSQPYETPHKCIPDNLDILQHSFVHISPAVFRNTFFHKTALPVAIFFSTQRCLLTKHQQCQTLFRGATAS